MKNRKYGKKLTFKREKETKNTVRYQEQGTDIVIGPLYMQKSALGKNPPEELTMSMERNPEGGVLYDITGLEESEEELETVKETA